MKFDLSYSIEILERTPETITALLNGVSENWQKGNEGENTWSPYDVVGHLIHAEKTNWIPRMEIILSTVQDKTFRPFDRFAQFENSKGKSLEDLTGEFKTLRKKNIEILKSRQLSTDDFRKTGIHPQLGKVSLEQLLSTWTVHDLTHIAQIVRAMAKQYKNAVGPWSEYLKILNV